MRRAKCGPQKRKERNERKSDLVATNFRVFRVATPQREASNPKFFQNNILQCHIFIPRRPAQHASTPAWNSCRPEQWKPRPTHSCVSPAVRLTRKNAASSPSLPARPAPPARAHYAPDTHIRPCRRLTPRHHHLTDATNSGGHGGQDCHMEVAWLFEEDETPVCWAMEGRRLPSCMHLRFLNTAWPEERRKCGFSAWGAQLRPLLMLLYKKCI